jgi:hypothetical protein
MIDQQASLEQLTLTAVPCACVNPVTSVYKPAGNSHVRVCELAAGWHRMLRR